MKTGNAQDAVPMGRIAYFYENMERKISINPWKNVDGSGNKERTAV